jgi:hypothetical protein
MFTKAEITTYIVSQLVDGIVDSISPSVMREVLIMCLDRRYEADEVGVTGLGEWQTLEQLLTDIIDSLETLNGGAHTPEEIRDALAGLGGTERLGKVAIGGAERSLNYRGRIKWNTYNAQLAMMIQPSKGDLWVYDDGGLPDESGYANGDVIVLLTDEPGSPPWNLNNKSSFMIWHLSMLNTLSIGSIVKEALEALSGDEMLSAEKISYGEEATVGEALMAMEESLDQKQKKEKHFRMICEDDDELLTLDIPGEVTPVAVIINRTPYYGIQGDFFEGMDYKYKHFGGNTVITLNPGLELVFVRNDIIDIRYTL